MIEIDLQPLFAARGIERPYTFLVEKGFTPHTANKLLHNKVKVISLSHMEMLCKAFHCEPYDFMVWTANKNEVLPDDFPLKKLVKKEIAIDWKETLAKMPLSQLSELTKKIKNKEL